MASAGSTTTPSATHALADLVAGFIPLVVTQSAIAIEVETLHRAGVIHNMFTHGGCRGFAFGGVELAITIGVELSEPASAPRPAFALTWPTALAASAASACWAHGLHVLADRLALGLIELPVAVGIKLFHNFFPIRAGGFVRVGGLEGCRRQKR